MSITHVPELEKYVKRLNYYIQEHYPAGKKISAEEWNALFLILINQGNEQEETLAKIYNSILPKYASTINELIEEVVNINKLISMPSVTDEMLIFNQNQVNIENEILIL